MLHPVLELCGRVAIRVAREHGKSPGAWECKVVSSGYLWEGHNFCVAEASQQSEHISSFFPQPGLCKPKQLSTML